MRILKTAVAGLAVPLAAAFMLPAEAEAPSIKIEQVALSNPKAYAESLVMGYDWNPTDMVCLAKLWGKESAWNYLADNPTSSAFGIAQLLGETSKDPARQIRQGLKYIKHRFSTPCRALAFHTAHGYY